MVNRPGNRTDQVVGDFFHSKTWRTILTIWIIMIVLPIVCGGVFFVMMFLGIPSYLLETVKLIPTTQAYVSRQQLTPFSVSVVAQVPNLNMATSTSDQSNHWQRKHVELFDFYVTIPDTWILIERDRIPPDILSIYNHDCANYSITSSDGKNILTLYMVCETGGGDNLDCPENSVFLSEEKIRYPDNAFQAIIYADALGDRNTCRTPGLWLADVLWIQIQYKSLEYDYLDITDFTIPDQIVKSISLTP
jgi:hypothetical protein